MFQLIKSSWPIFLEGAKNTLLLTLVSLVFAFFIGLIVGLMSTSNNKIAKTFARIYVDFIRGVPMLVLAYLIYFGLPSLTNRIGFHFSLSAFVAGLVTISLNAGAYMAEIIRGGILAVNKGQMEAARSLGLTRKMSMRFIILPQAIRMMIPSFINQAIISLKDTSIISVISYSELVRKTKDTIGRTSYAFEYWMIASLFYLAMILTISYIGRKIEKKLSYKK